MKLKWFAYVTGLFFLIPAAAKAQQVQGTVYDITQKFVIRNVSVLTTSGSGTMTDSAGFYNIRVTPGDSIWFSYLGKETPRYPVATIYNPVAFDISIQMSAIDLPAVYVRKRSYRADSLANRQEYAQLFDYRTPGLKTSMLSDGSMGAGVGVDLQELINAFNFKRNKSMRTGRDWMISEERDKYVDFRFNKELIQKLTYLYDEEEVEVFMRYYRPEYELVAIWNDAELGMYIMECLADFKKKNRLRKPD
ncbi:MAG: carboxypeptidase regulatory-like domain-containing protein [Chitinophagaceae bacterium]|nr:carboxypeptidase regulatory-like domain-containing protein [Chitinophagaceae bacterium]MCW5928425.1 carboxypeptidase regulatory-like domain-containing protein [Chitinophagaceae bacterium]